MTTIRCKGCGDIRRNFTKDHSDLCGMCSKDFEKKIQYAQDHEHLPPESGSEHETFALVCCDFDKDAQRIVDERIKRVTEEIQNNWSDEMREKRATSKKKSFAPPPFPCLGEVRKHQWITT
tara:strand:- start:14 stop:376 length:363 start_codon:yes stop_codon:yes gene_type:complete